MDDERYQPLREVSPPEPVTLDLAAMYGPRRHRWGQATPLWARSKGFAPTHSDAGVVEGCVMSVYGDWWVYCRTTLCTSDGVGLRDVGLLLPPDYVHRPAPVRADRPAPGTDRRGRTDG
jgi:hypothetical protein